MCPQTEPHPHARAETWLIGASICLTQHPVIVERVDVVSQPFFNRTEFGVQPTALRDDQGRTHRRLRPRCRAPGWLSTGLMCSIAARTSKWASRSPNWSQSTSSPIDRSPHRRRIRKLTISREGTVPVSTIRFWRYFPETCPSSTVVLRDVSEFRHVDTCESAHPPAARPRRSTGGQPHGAVDDLSRGIELSRTTRGTISHLRNSLSVEPWSPRLV